MGLPAPKFGNSYSYKDYLNWPEDERWELIEGVAFSMSPSPSRTHQRISGIIFNELYNYLKASDCEVYHAPFDVRLPNSGETEKDIKTVVQPDIVVVCDTSKLDDSGCIGPPDLVVEILSPNTLARDLRDKLILYERHGVREYWVVHPMDKVVMMFLLQENHLYARPEVLTLGQKLESKTFAGLNIEIDRIFM